MNNSIRRMPQVLLCLVALPAAADSLSALRTTVARMTAHQPLRATWSSDGLVKAAGKLANDARSRTVSVEVAHDGSSISVTIPSALTKKASHGPANDDGALSTIDSIRLASVVEALDFRETLLDLLDHGTLTEERRLVFRGHPARLLVLKLDIPQRKGKNEIVIGKVKIVEDRLHLWIADDGFPLAGERNRKTRAGFLIFSAESTSRTSYTFGRAGDRLILARLETSASGSALGTKIAESTVQTLTPR